MKLTSIIAATVMAATVTGAQAKEYHIACTFPKAFSEGDWVLKSQNFQFNTLKTGGKGTIPLRLRKEADQ